MRQLLRSLAAILSSWRADARDTSPLEARPKPGARGSADKVEMQLPESFHRQKRTLLIFSAALIVLGLSVPALNHQFSIGGVGGLTLSTQHARWALWLAAVYYLCGFVLEVGNARRLNSAFLDGRDLEKLEAGLAADVSNIHSYVGSLAGLVTELPNVSIDMLVKKSKAMDSRAELEYGVAQMLEEEVRHLNENLRQAQVEAGSEVVEARPLDADQARQWAKRVVNGPMEKWLQSLLDPPDAGIWGSSRMTIDGVNAEAATIGKQLDDFNHRLTRLSRSITGARRTSFWFWEIGGAAAAFAAATVLGSPFHLAESFGYRPPESNLPPAVCCTAESASRQPSGSQLVAAQATAPSGQPTVPRTDR